MVEERKMVVVAEFSVHPIGVGTGVSKYVASALKAIKEVEGVRFQVTPMSTILEAEGLSRIFEVVRVAHEAVAAQGAKRIYTTLIIDDRRDKPRVMEDKVQAVT